MAVWSPNLHAAGVLRGDGGNAAHAKHPQRRKCLQIRLNPGPSPRVRPGYRRRPRGLAPPSQLVALQPIARGEGRIYPTVSQSSDSPPLAARRPASSAGAPSEASQCRRSQSNFDASHRTQRWGTPTQC
eukprot:1189570-Prorocentrum_minimum.AAC.1